jgi:hypothetical protein
MAHRIHLSREWGVVALVAALTIGAWSLWSMHRSAPVREAAIRSKLQLLGHGDAELRRALFVPCPRYYGAGYRWRSAAGRGAACGGRDSTVFIFVERD